MDTPLSSSPSEGFLLDEALSPAEAERIAAILRNATPAVNAGARWVLPVGLAASLLLAAFLLSLSFAPKSRPAGESRLVLHVAMLDRPDRPPLRLEISYRKEPARRDVEASR